MESLHFHTEHSFLHKQLVGSVSLAPGSDGNLQTGRGNTENALHAPHILRGAYASVSPGGGWVLYRVGQITDLCTARRSCYT